MPLARACGDAFHGEFFGYGVEYEHLIAEARFTCHTLEPRLPPQSGRTAPGAGKVARRGQRGHVFAADILP